MLADLHCDRKNRSCRKIIARNITVPKTVKMWTLSSVATLEVPKSESRVKTKC